MRGAGQVARARGLWGGVTGEELLAGAAWAWGELSRGSGRGSRGGCTVLQPCLPGKLGEGLKTSHLCLVRWSTEFPRIFELAVLCQIFSGIGYDFSRSGRKEKTKNSSGPGKMVGSIASPGNMEDEVEARTGSGRPGQRGGQWSFS